MDIINLMQNPLTQTGRTGPFLRLVLAEAASFGMPPQVVATLDDVAAMLGYYDPLPANQAAHLAAPIIQWRTDRRQPTLENITDVDNLAMKQRALIAFGGAPADHTVGTAEIVSAMGNTHVETVPKPYLDVFHWASVDVLHTITGQDRAEIRKEKGWEDISDDDVLRPNGRLHATYVELATHIRRAAISALQGREDNPREYLRPIAAAFLQAHKGEMQEAAQTGNSRRSERLDESIATIKAMFPEVEADVGKWLSDKK